MNSLERFYKTIAYEPVDRPACWMGDPTPEEAAKLCEYYSVKNTSELKKVVGDDFYAVEIPYHSPTCNAIFAAFDWYMNGSNVDTEHRTLTADGCFANCEDLDEVEAVNFPWPDRRSTSTPSCARSWWPRPPRARRSWACCGPATSRTPAPPSACRRP